MINPDPDLDPYLDLDLDPDHNHACSGVWPVGSMTEHRHEGACEGYEPEQRDKNKRTMSPPLPTSVNTSRPKCL